MKPFALFLIVFLSLSAVSAQNSADQNPAARQLYALFDAEWRWNLENNPVFASYLGDKRFNDRWNDASLAAIDARHERRKAALDRLKKIDRAALSPADRLNYDLFRKDLETDIEQFQYGFYLKPVTQQGGIQTSDDLSNFLSFETVKDYEDWIARLNAFPALAEQTIALMREGMRRGVVGSQQVLNRVPAQIEKQIVASPERSAFYKPFLQINKDIPASEQARLREAAKRAIQEKIVPSFRRLKEFFVEDYFPAAFKDAGIWQMTGGDRAYESLARSYTTTDLTPKEIHETGLREVARIRGEMEKIKTQVGFAGTLQEFFQHLRTDPKFYYKTPDELLNAYRAVSKRIDPELTRLFKTLPRTPYGVIPIPDAIAPDTTTAYYNSPSADGKRPGYYYVNLYKPETRPKYEMMALSIHEAVPGHHLQLALQQELGELPNFRKFGGYTAFVEGWGLYSESLGDEMGLYSDPYDKFGQLTYEMWRAVRLVVDTGMHYFKWDRQRAINYFRNNAAKSEQDIVNEIDRYISDPGQALAYKIGELKIKELRARAKRELGDKFDVREFHDVVLLSGAVPLDILERNVNEWIAKMKGGAVAESHENKQKPNKFSPPEESSQSYADWLERQVIYTITREEKDVFLKLKDNADREWFIVNFWKRRDPTGETEANEYKEEHYRRIARANETFAIKLLPGWKTDRGRIFILFGKPDETVVWFDEETKSWAQAWHYRKIEGVAEDVKFVFADFESVGNYRLTQASAGNSRYGDFALLFPETDLQSRVQRRR